MSSNGCNGSREEEQGVSWCLILSSRIKYPVQGESLYIGRPLLVLVWLVTVGWTAKAPSFPGHAMTMDDGAEAWCAKNVGAAIRPDVTLHAIKP